MFNGPILSNKSITNKCMFFRLKSSYPGSIRNEIKSVDAFCHICKRELCQPKYQGPSCLADSFIHEMEPNRRKLLKRWPMAIGSLYTLMLHQDLVEIISKSTLAGIRFHETPPIEGKVNDYLPSAPKYYVVEPTGNAEFIPSPEDFRNLDCICKLDRLELGPVNSPLVIKKRTWNGADFFKVTNYFNYDHMIFVTKNVIDLLIENDWVSEFSIGDHILPGKKVKDFSEGWYERTLLELQDEFPNYRVMDDETY